jgi:hypothetical protein
MDKLDCAAAKRDLCWAERSTAPAALPGPATLPAGAPSNPNLMSHSVGGSAVDGHMTFRPAWSR